VTTLSRHQSHVCTVYFSDIITHLLYFSLQQHWLFLPTWLKSVNLHHLVQSKWKSVNLDIISWLTDIKFHVRNVHSGIATVCDKGKGTAISVLAYCRPKRVPGGWGSRISIHVAHEGGQVVILTYPPCLHPRKYSWYSFL